MQQTVTGGDEIYEAAPPSREGYIFLYWSASQNGGAASFPQKVKKNLHFYARWQERKKCKVTLNPNGGELKGDSVLEVYEGDDVILETPTKTDGYGDWTFEGWYVNNGSVKAESPYTVDKSVSLVARWKTKYKVTLEPSGGVLSGPDSFWVDAGDAVNLETPTKTDGYGDWTFEGWYVSNGSVKAESPYTVDKSVRLVARWKTKYKVTLEPSGGVLSGPDSFWVDTGDAVNLETPTKTDGYGDWTFEGWYVSNGSVKAESPYTVDKSVRLVARWKTKFQVTIDPNGGSFDGPKSYWADGGTKIAWPGTPTREGYTFNGWYLNSSTSAEAMFPYVLNGNIRFTANWGAKTKYTVTLEPNGGKTASGETKFTVNGGDEFADPGAPTRNDEEKGGYTFTGWTRNSTGIDVKFPYIVNTNVLFAANWKTKCKVTLDLNGGELASGEKEKVFWVDYGEQIAWPGTPTKHDETGDYTFTGWYRGGIPRDFPYPITTDTTFTAGWKTKCKVTLDLDGGTLPSGEKEKVFWVDYDEQIAWPGTPTKSDETGDYEFTGWYRGGLPREFPYPITTNTTFTAGWTKKIKRKVTLELAGGTLASGEEVFWVDDGTKIELETPTKHDETGDYTFTGWYRGGIPREFPYPITTDTTFTATWKTRHKVTLDLDGGTFPSGEKEKVFWVDYGEQIAWPGTPTKSDETGDYEFTGWYRGGLPREFPYPITTDTTFTAGWAKKIKRKVTLELAGGTLASGEEEFWVDDGTKLELETPTKHDETGDYTFTGWWKGGSERSFPYPITADSIFTATWKARYKVILDLDGGILPSGEKGKEFWVNSGEQIAWPGTPTKEGYTFTGWYIGNSYAKNFPYPITGNTTFRAGWTQIIKRKVTLDLAGGTLASGEKKKEFWVEDGTRLELETPTKHDETGDYTFTGWLINGRDKDIPYRVAGDITCTAIWKTKCKVTLDLDGGSLASDTLDFWVDQGSQFAYPGTPTKSDETGDYEFNGWHIGNSSAKVFPYAITGDTTFKAWWTKKIKHKVTLDLAGGTLASSENEKEFWVEDGTQLELETPTKHDETGDYTFTGWLINGRDKDIPYRVTGDITCTARWKTKCKVTLDLDGGSLASDTLDFWVDQGSQFAYPGTPTKSDETGDYEFNGWRIGNSSAKVFPYAITGDTTFKAWWTKKIKYKVTLDLAGGTLASGKKEKEFWVEEGTRLELETPTKHDETGDYTFTGWLINGKDKDIPYKVAGNITCTAQWKTKYKVTLNLDGGSLASVKTDFWVDQGSQFAYPGTPTKEGCMFTGWYINTSEKSFPYAINGTTTFRAGWKQRTEYNVALKLNGGTLTPNKTEFIVEEGGTFERPSEPTRSGYTFDDWYIDGEKATFPYTVKGQAVFVAQWKKKCTVTLKPNGGTLDPAVYNFVINEGDTLELKTPTRAGNEEGSYTFEGWYDGDREVTSPYTVMKDATLIAKWRWNRNYKVTLNTNGGSLTGALSTWVAAGSKFGDPGIPTKGDYEFTGWYDGSEKVTFSYTVTKDVTLIAHWKRKCTVVLQLNGGSVDGGASFAVNEGDTLELKTPTKNGSAEGSYTFEGWYDGDEKVTSPYTVMKDATLIAKWRWNRNYKVTLNTNGGSLTGALSTWVAAGSKFGDPGIPIRGDYEFTGWYDGSEKVTFSYTVTKDVTLIAHWKRKCTVVLQLNGGTVDGGASFAVNEGDTLELKTPTRAGNEEGSYTFEGWYDGDEKVTSPYTVMKDVTLIAKWRWNRNYKVTLNTNGGSLTGALSTWVAAGGKFEDPGIPIRGDYEFTGWYDGSEKVTFSYTVTKDVTLIAHWKQKYTVILKPNGGKLAAAGDTFVLDAGDVFADPGDPTRTGDDTGNYTFEGWYDGKERVTFPYTVKKDVILTAKWRWNENYKVTLNKNGGTMTGEPETWVAAGDSFKDPGDPTRNDGKGDYVFTGWYDGDQKVTFPYTVTKNVTLTAHWKQKYTVILKPNGGKLAAEGDSFVLDAGDMFADPGDPTRTGDDTGNYTFEGWYDGNERVTFPYTVKRDVILTAKWRWNGNYKVTLNANGGTMTGDTTIWINESTPLQKLAEPTRSDGMGKYTFTGWYNGDEAVIFPYTVTKNVTFTAHWKKKCTVTLKPNGGSLASAVDSFVVNEGDKLTELETPTKNGSTEGSYAFEGWYDGDQKVLFPYTVTKDVSLTAHWTKKCHVVLRTNDGKLDGKQDFWMDEGSALESLGTPEKEDHTFDGWYINNERAVFPYTVNGDVIFTARYKTKCTVTLNLKSGKLASGDTTIQVDKGTKFADPGRPTRTGCTFEGWYVDGLSTEAVFPYTVNENVTFTAKWYNQESGVHTYEVLLAKGERYDASVAIDPNMSDEYVTWTVNDKTMLTVHQNNSGQKNDTAQFEALKNGTCTVTATLKSDPDTKYVWNVVVYQRMDYASLRVLYGGSYHENSCSVYSEESFPIETVWHPENAEAGITVSYSSSDANTATVDSSGMVHIGRVTTARTVTITAKVIAQYSRNVYNPTMTLTVSPRDYSHGAVVENHYFKGMSWEEFQQTVNDKNGESYKVNNKQDDSPLFFDLIKEGDKVVDQKIYVAVGHSKSYKNSDEVLMKSKSFEEYKKAVENGTDNPYNMKFVELKAKPEEVIKVSYSEKDEIEKGDVSYPPGTVVRLEKDGVYEYYVAYGSSKSNNSLKNIFQTKTLMTSENGWWKLSFSD